MLPAGRPFRMPRCPAQAVARVSGASVGGASVGGASVGGASVGDNVATAAVTAAGGAAASGAGVGGGAEERISRLGRRQWEGRSHAVLDTLVKAAVRVGGAPAQRRLLEALRSAAQSSSEVAAVLGSFVEVLLRRHLRPTQPRTAPTNASNSAAASASSSHADDHAALVSHLCASLPRHLRTHLLAFSLPVLVSGVADLSALFAEALPMLDARLGRLRALILEGEEAEVLTAAVCAADLTS